MNRKQILVTGASRGIGRAAALAFAKEQDNLIITCQKNKELLDQVKQEAEAEGSVCLAFAGDMGDFSFCQEVFAKAHRHGLYPDLVINNAGISHIGLLPLFISHILQQADVEKAQEAAKEQAAKDEAARH